MDVEYLIHTDMSYDAAVQYLKQYSTVTVEQGRSPMTSGGGRRIPDCMFGWGKPCDSAHCRPHVLVHVVGEDEQKARRLVRAIARILVEQTQSQCVVTDTEGAPPPFPAAGRYTDNHEHPA